MGMRGIVMQLFTLLIYKDLAFYDILAKTVTANQKRGEIT